ncbi:MAG TPA: ribose-phosphate diphosphokinase [Burkholderiales bacterium]|nr:ribose-phosphate diphosphokinase [Burkholderiales bacterium]
MSAGPVVLAGDAHPALAADIARRCGAPLLACPVAAFADGETRVRIEGELAGADLYVVQPTCAPTNERLMTLALMADAARAAGAARVTALVPYFGYARQDVRKHPGEPRSAQLAARLLAAAGVDRLVALDLHSPALESAFTMPVVHLLADEALLPALRAWALPKPMIVSPDAGGLKRAQRCAGALGAPLAVLAKTRPRADVAQALEVLGDVRGRDCVILDDMASTGGTIAAAAEALRAAGAQSVHALFVHAVLAPGALERLGAARLGRVATTDSVPPPPAARLEVIGIAPLLAAALTRLAAH